MIVAGFAGKHRMHAALARLRDASLHAETYTPGPPVLASPDATASPLPAIMLAAFVLVALGFFALQVYADTIAYPLDIGGRPNNSWPAFVCNAFEAGVLCAIAVGVFGFILINRLPRYHHPIDACEAMREATRDGWFIAVRDGDPKIVRALLATENPFALEQVPD